MPRRPLAAWVTAATLALAAGGCGAGQHAGARHATKPPGQATSQGRSASATQQPATNTPVPSPGVNPTPPPTGRPPSPAAINIIRAWSNALRRGDVRGAARWFAVPSVMINGSGAGATLITIHSYADAVAANESLPCGALFVSADQRGPYVNALFRLTQRSGVGGGGCGSGVGLTARTNFLIADGRIHQWLRAPDEPGDSATRRGTKPRAPSGARPPLVPSTPVV